MNFEELKELNYLLGEIHSLEKNLGVEEYQYSNNLKLKKIQIHYRYKMLKLMKFKKLNKNTF